MNILHVVPTYFPAVRYGGPIWSVHGLAAAQAALGHGVRVFTTNVDGNGVSDVPLDRSVAMDGVEVRYFPVGMPRRLYRSPAMAAAIGQAASDADIVHLHSVFLWPTMAAARAALRAKRPYVLSPRGMLVDDLIRARSAIIKRLWIALIERRTIREAAALHMTARREIDDFFALGLTARRIIDLPNGVDLPPATLPTAPPSADIAQAVAGGRYLLYFGRINWKKNLPALITAMARVPDLRLIIAGNDEEGDAAGLHAIAAGVGLGDRFSLIARSIDGADKEHLFATASIFALPSLNENFGNTVLEAMVRGVPVVVSDGAGVADVVREAGAGIVSAPDEAALAAAITTLAALPSGGLAAMGAAGRDRARAAYGWEGIARRMIDAYAGLSPGG